MKKLVYYCIIFFCFYHNLSLAQTTQNQESKAPFKYTTETVNFINNDADSIKLSGTLTLPKHVKNPPVAILISGSGPQDRDGYSKSLHHKPFLVISKYLAHQGIAVLRYDDRGVAKSKGNFKTATSFDFASDVTAAINLLKQRQDINTSKIGLIGHSEGGLIAPMVAAANTDVAFIVMLAGTGVDGGKILQTQSRKMMALLGTPDIMLDENEKLTTIIYDAIKNYKHIDTIKTKIKNGLNDFKARNPLSVVSPAITPVLIEQQFKILESRWLLTFIRTDPKNYLEKTKCPILVLNGSKDVQVLPEINIPKIEKALIVSGNTDVTIKIMDGLNHLFQNAKTGSVKEYNVIEEAISKNVLQVIGNWINLRF